MSAPKDFGDVIAAAFDSGFATFEFALTDGRNIRAKVVNAGADFVEIERFGKSVFLNPDNIVEYSVLDPKPEVKSPVPIP